MRAPLSWLLLAGCCAGAAVAACRYSGGGWRLAVEGLQTGVQTAVVQLQAVAARGAATVQRACAQGAAVLEVQTRVLQGAAKEGVASLTVQARRGFAALTARAQGWRLLCERRLASLQLKGGSEE